MTFEYKGRKKKIATRIISYIDDIYEVGQTFNARDAIYQMTHNHKPNTRSNTRYTRKNIPQQRTLSMWLKANPRFQAVGYQTGLWRRVE